MFGFFKKKIISLIISRMVDKPLVRSVNHLKLKDIKQSTKNIFKSFGNNNLDKTFYVIRINYGGGIFSILLYVFSRSSLGEEPSKMSCLSSIPFLLNFLLMLSL